MSPALKSLGGFAFRISCGFHLTGKTAVLCFIKNGLLLLKIQPLQSFLWLITLPDLSFRLLCVFLTIYHV